MKNQTDKNVRKYLCALGIWEICSMRLQTQTKTSGGNIIGFVDMKIKDFCPSKKNDKVNN